MTIRNENSGCECILCDRSGLWAHGSANLRDSSACMSLRRYLSSHSDRWQTKWPVMPLSSTEGMQFSWKSNEVRSIRHRFILNARERKVGSSNSSRNLSFIQKKLKLEFNDCSVVTGRFSWLSKLFEVKRKLSTKEPLSFGPFIAIRPNPFGTDNNDS